jgi:hypothetical protein
MEPTAVEQAGKVRAGETGPGHPSGTDAAGFEQRSVADRVADEHKLKVTPSDQPGKGRVGSLVNPEVYEDVPGHVIPII